MIVAVLVLAGHYGLPPAWAERQIQPDFERNAFAALSAGALLAAAVLTFLAVRRGSYPPLAVGVGAILGAMAADEWFEVHEAIERSLDTNWSVVYLPVVAVAAVCALRLVRTLLPSWSAFALLAGGAAWAGSFVLEQLQWSGDVRRAHYGALMITEEMLELGGSLLFVTAALLAGTLARTGARTRAAGFGRRFRR
jgi:hypothetical protein